MSSHHPTIENFFIAIKSNNVDELKTILDQNVVFKPPTYGRNGKAETLWHIYLPM